MSQHYKYFLICNEKDYIPHTNKIICKLLYVTKHLPAVKLSWKY